MKRIALHADDYGYHPHNDSYMLRLLDSGILSSVSIIATHSSKQSLRRLRSLGKRKSISCGLHFNIVEGKSLASPNRIPSLVDRKGNFYPRHVFLVRLLSGRIQKADVAEELRAQYAALSEDGIHITAIDTHQHMHAFSPVSDVVSSFAKEKKLEVRSFGSVIPQTIQSKFIVSFFQILAYLSSVTRNHELTLPSSWRVPHTKSWSIMSWEGVSYDCRTNDTVFHVVHPGLNYDTNRSYTTLLR
ncbi:ChbG/HpnK family deacetylase [Candidatus Roizmanbacteria bacterium]|nr:ChbG/HpnK family deacetylase [Candidatus Roizmanbacteria bacterium]